MGKTFNQPVKNNKVTYENIRTIVTGEGDDYTTGCLLDYNYFRKYYKMIVVDLNKQQALDEVIQQVDFIENLDREIIRDSISFLKKQKKLFLIFHKEP